MQGDGVLSEGLPCIKGNTCCHSQRNRVGVSERYTVHQSQKARSINIIHTSIHPHSPSNHQTQPSIHSIPSYPSRPNHQSHPSIPRPFSPIHTSIRPLIHPIHPPIPSHPISSIPSEGIHTHTHTTYPPNPTATHHPTVGNISWPIEAKCQWAPHHIGKVPREWVTTSLPNIDAKMGARLLRSPRNITREPQQSWTSMTAEVPRVIWLSLLRYSP